MDNGQKNEMIMQKFMQENGVTFGVPDEFRDETPDESVIFDEWEGDGTNGKE
ncbi:MAG: hypothetical protein NC293_03580 [Roseburia sp.]|nr:hypothetical protein [Roseburia sp.]